MLAAPVVTWADETSTADPARTDEEAEQQADESVRPYFVGEVIVSAEEEPSPGTVDVLDAKTIEESGVTTVAEALQLVPGISLSTGSKNEQKIWVRGYEQSNVLVLVDGVPVSDPYYGDLDLGQLPVFDIAQITVTRGGASSLYGPNGLGGVINVVTLQGGESSRLAGQLRLTENRTAIAHASTGGGSGRLSWYLGLGVESSDGWDLADDFEATPYEDGDVRVNSDFKRLNAMARIGWRLDENSSLYTSIRWVDAEKGIPFHTTKPSGFVKFSRFPEWRQSTVALGYERRLQGGGELRAQLYELDFDNTLEVFRDKEMSQSRLESTFADRVLGGYVLGRWQLAEKHAIGTALHLRNDRHRKTEKYPDGSTDPSERYHAWTSSLSVEDRWSVTQRTNLVASLALDRLRVEEARSLRTVGGTEELVGDPRSNDTLISPQLEIRSQLGENWWASAAVYRRSRFPTMRQLYGTDIPNPDLRPQRNTGIDVGLTWAVGKVTIRGDFFADEVRDLISRQGRDEPYRNQDEAEFRGIELRADGRAQWLDYSVSWTGLDHRFTHSSEGMDEIPYVPRSQLEMLAVAHLGARFDLRGTWLMVGNRVFYDRGVKRDLGRYEVFDLSLAHTWNDFEFSIHGDNLFDANIEQEEGFPAPGRRIWAGVRFKFEP